MKKIKLSRGFDQQYRSTGKHPGALSFPHHVIQPPWNCVGLPEEIPAIPLNNYAAASPQGSIYS
jgi:hypothetical protein